MQTSFRTNDRILMHMLLIVASFGVATSSANASYTVIDDDLLPTSVAESRSTQQALALHYTVPFAKNRSPLTLSGRITLDTLIPQMSNASIRIVGRPDAMSYTSGKFALLAVNRGNNMRDYLMRQGIPSSSITVANDNTPNPQLNGSIYPSEIYITRTENNARFSAASYALAKTYSSTQTTPQPQRAIYQAPIVAPANPARDQLIQFINQAVQSGQMEPAIALKLMHTLMESEPNNPSQFGGQRISAQTPAPQPQTPAPQFIATSFLARNETWVLDKKLTLRDNVDAWSKSAGWNPSVWDASNFYQITANSTLEGGFPDVLRQIADSTGLNICAKKREKYVRVTDSTVSCK